MLDLKTKYDESIKKSLQEEFSITNPMQIPKIEKIMISVASGEAGRDSKLMQNMTDTISLIAGQKAVVTNAKKSVAAFKLREGMPTGIKVTLRGKAMYNFLQKLIFIALPRVKDFRGINRNGFDGRGNFNFGLQEQLMFPEVVYDDIIKTHGMNITIVTTTNDDKMAFKMLEQFGMPFTKGRN